MTHNSASTFIGGHILPPANGNEWYTRHLYGAGHNQVLILEQTEKGLRLEKWTASETDHADTFRK